ncbi:trypsin-like serine protease [Mycoplasmopsis cricetuli]|uniref:trypsin-like serine protease n=1 Tax=Mycoplasmopsis cricetuli TaxID=171283 RepID=UPI000472680F|nr:trypsin-like serine protease [Mycoplasmopsis cricetuli]
MKKIIFFIFYFFSVTILTSCSINQEIKNNSEKYNNNARENWEKNVAAFTLKLDNHLISSFNGTIIKENGTDFLVLTSAHVLKPNLNKKIEIFINFLNNTTSNNNKKNLKGHKIIIEEIYRDNKNDLLLFKFKKINHNIYKNFEINYFTNEYDIYFFAGYRLILTDNNFSFKQDNLSKLVSVSNTVQNIFYDTQHIFILENNNFSDGNSGSPLFNGDKIIGIYRGKKIFQNKLRSFFVYFTNNIFNKLNEFIKNF